MAEWNPLAPRQHSPRARWLAVHQGAARRRRANIAMMYTNGVLVSEIAQHYDISRARVYELLEKHRRQNG